MQFGTAAQLGIDSKQVQDFYRDVWSRPIALSDPAFYSWQFVDTALDTGLDSCVIAYDEKAMRVAAAMGLTPRDFNLGHTRLKGAELTTWATAEAYRNTGAGAKVLKHIMANYDVLIGMGISDDALTVYLRSGFKFLREIPRFVKVLDYEQIKDFCQTTGLGARLAKKWATVSAKDYDAGVATPADINAAHSAMKTQFNFFTRDAQTLEWRYNKHPDFTYAQFWVRPRGSAAQAIVVLRLHKTDQGFAVLHVVDLFGDLEAINAARQFVENYGVDNGAQVIDFYCTSAAIYAQFVANNWFSTSNDTHFCFPHLFSPLELRSPQTTSLIYWAKDHLADLANTAQLYITKQDADLDRPNPVQTT